jgi:hypothetical protein
MQKKKHMYLRDARLFITTITTHSHELIWFLEKDINPLMTPIILILATKFQH